MIEEIELKILNSKEEVEELLLGQGFTILFKRRTIANYYLLSNQKVGDHRTLKERCVRIRTSYKIDEKIGKLGFSLLDLSKSQDEEKFSFRVAKKKEKELQKNNYKLIHTDDKTDFVYVLKEKDIAFQIQDINGLGTIVAYDNKKYYHLSREEQREKLIADVKFYGINIKDYNQVDRFEMIGKTKKLTLKEIYKTCKKK